MLLFCAKVLSVVKNRSSVAEVQVNQYLGKYFLWDKTNNKNVCLVF